MVKLGRPRTINKKDIIAISCDFYWNYGIQNVSFNDAIKNANVSKGTIYNLFTNLDNLHKETFKYYYENFIKNEIEKEIDNYDDVFDALRYLEKKMQHKNYKPCYFYISNSVKKHLGKMSINFLDVIESKMKEMLKNLLIRHINKYKLNNRNIDVYSLSILLLHNFSFLNILKHNKTNSKERQILINSIKSRLLQELIINDKKVIYN